MIPPTTVLAPAPPLIARQPIVDHRQQVIGYELFNRSRTATPNPAASDVLLVFTALSHVGAEEIVGTKLLFVNCSHESLAGGHLDLLNPAQMVLEIPPLGHAAQDEVTARLPILAQLRAQGFRLAFGHSVLDGAYAPWLQLADYIKLDMSALAAERLGVLVPYARRLSSAQLIAAKVETPQQHESAARYGMQLFQGSLFARPAEVHTQLLAPAQAHIIELINLLRQQAGTEAIEQVLKKDAGLAFNLMRMINSAGMGLRRPVNSFREAVMILGLRRLFRWAALLFTATRDGGPPSSVCQKAVVRARLMELLALEAGMDADQADHAFVTGLFSLLDAMLPMPLAPALALVGVPEAVSSALLQGEGPLAMLLTLATACESSDDAAFDHAARSLALGSTQINGAHLQALAWADHLADSL
ncbi:EAL and HDOD domain-containing protein [Comamonas endophytica]|uniref:HDOD domain-containing protein n=1 Tax=Comamonas endophytica TaxID=2949090 RepID=A0ABY6GBB9_9BURK|nr:MULTISPECIES: HDOD domain-containing protein [unclassified Acidovorax]MCD2513628.1 HDOD domain-containing protein [Acidovorax sp. D4N7]UYG52364.1 HDOD domain-containing protein [Acidovorax sp. 5MLIR]